MHLIDALVAGVRGAENGSALLTRRGTSTEATHYTDFEGTVVGATGAITLDANGGAEIYVDGMVSVQVLDSDGDEVRNFVAGSKGSAVEVNGQSFTGTSYDDGSGDTTTAASQPVSLKTVLDLWKTQQGAIDWKVLFGGNAVTIQAALASISGMFYNVKDPTYGAVGDGGTDDATAIQAAINAANSAGGGVVYFPQGTYLIQTALTCHDGVSMWGVSTTGSVITIDHATANALSFSGPDTAATGLHDYTTIRDLTIKAEQSNTGKMITASAGGLRLENLILGDGTNAKGTLINDSGGCQWNITNCQFFLALITQSAALLRDADTEAYIEGCWFTPLATGASTSGIIGISEGRIVGCHFANDLCTSGTIEDIVVTGNVTITGCRFPNGGGGTITAIKTDTLASDETLSESGNSFGDTVIRYNFVASTDETKVWLGSRDTNWATTLDNSASVSLDPDQFGMITIQRQSGAAITVNLVSTLAQAPEGATFFLGIWNDGTGGNVTLTAGTRMNLAAGGVAVISDNDLTIFQFKALTAGGNSDVEWYQVGTAQDVNET